MRNNRSWSLVKGGIPAGLDMMVSGVNLSTFGRAAFAHQGSARTRPDAPVEPVLASDPLKDPASEEYRELQELKQRDREVRQHEQAHMAAGGAYVQGGPTFSYQRGPDGRQYAIGGEVQIDTSAIPGDPEATLRKMQVVRSAALAPAEPSAQDRAVAAAAAKTEAEARVELREERQAEAAPDQAGEDTGAAVVESALAAYRQLATDVAAATAGRRPLDLVA